MYFAIVFCAFLAAFFHQTSGHGMMLDPINRSSMWRYDDSYPANYEDNQNYCGGMNVSSTKNRGFFEKIIACKQAFTTLNCRIAVVELFMNLKCCFRFNTTPTVVNAVSAVTTTWMLTPKLTKILGNMVWEKSPPNTNKEAP